MSKKMRQYIGIIAAVIFYYIVHEGAHFVAALMFHAFKSIKFLGLGMQVDMKAVFYYVTIIMLILDPTYLSAAFSEN